MHMSHTLNVVNTGSPFTVWNSISNAGGSSSSYHSNHCPHNNGTH